MPFLDSLSFAQILWLVPALFALHNLEEVPGMAAWSRRIDARTHPRVSTPQFVIAVTFLTLVALVATLAGVQDPRHGWGVNCILLIQAILWVNAFVPHVLATIRHRLYSPGLVTAVLVNIPFSFYLFYRALAEGYLSPEALVALLIMAPFAMAASSWLSLKLGDLILRVPRNGSVGHDHPSR
jgi:hypothetical protein